MCPMCLSALALAAVGGGVGGGTLGALLLVARRNRSKDDVDDQAAR
jgi:hypothetical protein